MLTLRKRQEAIMTKYYKLILIGLFTTLSLNTFASELTTPFPSNKKEVRFMKKINKKLDKAQRKAKKFLNKYDERELRYHFYPDIERKINYEKKFAVRVTYINNYTNITKLLTYISGPQYRLDFINAVRNEIQTLGSFKKYKNRTLYSYKAKLCIASKVGIGTIGVGFAGVGFVGMLGIGFMPFWGAPLGWYLLGGATGGISLSGVSFWSMTKYSCYGKK